MDNLCSINDEYQCFPITASAIKCYQCNSYENPQCENMRDYPPHNVSHFYQECKDGYQGQSPFCRITITEGNHKINLNDNESRADDANTWNGLVFQTAWLNCHIFLKMLIYVCMYWSLYCLCFPYNHFYFHLFHPKQWKIPRSWERPVAWCDHVAITVPRPHAIQPTTISTRKRSANASKTAAIARPIT